MAKNSVILDTLILFYIEMKHSLQTKNLDETVFIDQMLKYCKEKGFNKFSGKVMRNVWAKLVSKYQNLKCKGTIEEKQNWQYFEILDSSYEELDFSSDKFSTDMVWFMIEYFLKRRGSEKTHKLNDIFTELHREFLKCGYTHVSKQYIKDKWKQLNFNCNKFKNDPTTLAKVPHLEAIKALQDSRCTVHMAFTRNLTEHLIRFFTESKVACIIQGYDSDRVLSEVQTKYKDMGVYFSKEDIKEKWQKLTNIYEFLTAKGITESGWIYFDPMKNHFKNDFLSCKMYNEEINGQVDDKRRCLRPRSKSVGLSMEKLEKMHVNKNRSSKRSHESREKTKFRKKLKVEDEVVETDAFQTTENCVKDDDVRNIAQVPLNNSSNINEQRRNSTVIQNSTKTLQIINIEESDIDQKSGNLTINIPSITKQFSDKEFLPLKKRLWSNGETRNHPEDPSKKMKGLNGHEEEFTTEHKLLNDVKDDERKKSVKLQSQNEVVGEKSDNFSLEKLNDNFSEKCHIKLHKDDHQEKGSLQKYVAPNAFKKSPVVLLVIKMDGSKRILKDKALLGVDMKADIPSTSQTHGSCDIKKMSETLKNDDGNSRLKDSAVCGVEMKADEPNSPQTDGSSDNKKIKDILISTQKLCAILSSPVSKSEDGVNITENKVRAASKTEVVSDAFDDATSHVSILSNEDVADLNSSAVENVFCESKTEKCSVIEGTEANLNTKQSDFEWDADISSETDISKNSPSTNAIVKRSWSGFKFVSQVIKPAITQNVTLKATVVPPSLKSCPSLGSSPSVAGSCGRNEDFDNESICSEAIGEDDHLKDNLLATVIDFQEQNNHEFIEIKNLMKQNNLLQRETNRLLRLMLEQM